jgi:2-dehydro-3-deoxyphosphooctonate aldolase (KDO 8-P synthase)
MPRSIIKVGRNTLGGKELLFILGPCVIESAAFTRRMARKLKTICDDLGAQFVFKASYDKANRTSVRSFRGTTVRDGCELLAEIGVDVGVPVTTDVHSPQEVEIAAQYIDIIQIPAFLCRQTDLVLAAGGSGRVVNVKKGQFLAPWDVKNIAAKLQSAGCRAFFFTERGATFGYNNLVADMRSIYWMQQLNYQVVFDATHSVQRPGGAGDRTGGDGELAPVLARAAVAVGCDGVFIETHENPAKALSDGPNQIPLRSLPKLLDLLRRIRREVLS